MKIIDVRKESCPAAQFIGKRYSGAANWTEWWENGWFDILESLPRLPFNDDAYIGAVRIADGKPERWIGMFFPAGVKAPDGFESIAVVPTDFAVFYLQGPENTPHFYTMDTHNRCLQLLGEHGWTPKEDGWCFERYQCPRFTTPDENGNVILDYGIAIR